MNDGATSEIKGAELCKPPAAPYPVSDRKVDKGGPQRNKQHPRAKLHPSDDSARDKCYGDRCERHFESRVNARWYRPNQRIRFHHIMEEEVSWSADKPVHVRAKHQGVSINEPDDAYHSVRRKRQEEGIQDGLFFYEPGIEQSQSRNRHQHYESRRHKHPRGISRIENGNNHVFLRVQIHK